jgi:hypothetical protein
VCLFISFETGSHYVAQAGFQLKIFLSAEVTDMYHCTQQSHILDKSSVRALKSIRLTAIEGRSVEGRRKKMR